MGEASAAGTTQAAGYARHPYSGTLKVPSTSSVDMMGSQDDFRVGDESDVATRREDVIQRGLHRRLTGSVGGRSTDKEIV